MKKQCMNVVLMVCITVSSSGCEELFVKPRKQRGLSAASLQEECINLMADMLEISQTCLQKFFGVCSHPILELQKSITKTIRNVFSNDASISRLSKAELANRRDRLILLKKRFHTICNELNRCGDELHTITKELKELEATW